SRRNRSNPERCPRRSRCGCCSGRARTEAASRRRRAPHLRPEPGRSRLSRRLHRIAVTMPIQVACSCGKKLHVRDELSGKKIKCPACGGVLAVDGQSPAPAKPPPAPSVKTAPPALPEAAAPKKREEQESSPSYWDCQRDFTNGLLVVTGDALWFNKLADKELK